MVLQACLSAEHHLSAHRHFRPQGLAQVRLEQQDPLPAASDVTKGVLPITLLSANPTVRADVTIAAAPSFCSSDQLSPLFLASGGTLAFSLVQEISNNVRLGKTSDMELIAAFDEYLPLRDDGGAFLSIYNIVAERARYRMDARQCDEDDTEDCMSNEQPRVCRRAAVCAHFFFCSRTRTVIYGLILLHLS